MTCAVKYGIVTVFVLMVCAADAQGIRDTVVQMKTIAIQSDAMKVETHIISNGDMEPDKEYQTGKRVSDILEENTSVYLKNYGVGQLSSISINGSSAAQATVLWDGIKLNNPNTGQVDLALFDMGTVDNINVINKATNQSVGGILALNNTPVCTNDTLISSNVIRYGSFNTLNLSSNNIYTLGNFSGSTKVNYLRSDNDFPFLNNTQIGAPIERETNAATELLSFLQQLDLRVKRIFNVGAMFWVTDADREIPPVMTDPSGFEREWDKSYRSMAYFNGRKNAFKFSLKSAYLYDWLRYIDPLTNTDSRASAQAIRNLFNVSYDLRRFHLDGALSYDHETATSSGFNNTESRDISGINLSASYRYLRYSDIGISIKQELLGSQALPFAPGAFVSWGKTIRKQSIHVCLNGARTYRLPALNDLYWSVGGNPKLQPEHAWNSSLNADYALNGFVKVTANGFYNYVTNWILWTPDQSGLWTAQNVKRVLSRGLNLSARVQNKANLKDKGFFVVFYAGYSYTSTISLDAMQVGDNSKDKQLIYVPRHNFTASLQLQYRRYYIRTTHSYISERFTSTDDSQILPGYYLSNLEAGKDFYFNRQQMGVSFRVNNITNTQYQMVAMYPMAGRNYEVTVRLNLTK